MTPALFSVGVPYLIFPTDLNFKANLHLGTISFKTHYCWIRKYTIVSLRADTYKLAFSLSHGQGCALAHVGKTTPPRIGTSM